jgi:hypothetical protein
LTGRELKNRTRFSTKPWQEQVVRRTDGCWIWQGHLSSSGGHPLIKLPDRASPVTARRVVYEDSTKENVKKSLYLIPTCGTNRCVSPKHALAVPRTTSDIPLHQNKIMDNTGCTHFWMIPMPNGATSMGTCTLCGTTREMANSIETARRLPGVEIGS